MNRPINVRQYLLPLVLLVTVHVTAGCGGTEVRNEGTTPVTARPSSAEPAATMPAGDPAAAASAATGMTSPSASGAEDDPLVARFQGFTAPKPAAWTWYPPESRMRAANYVVPGTSGENQAHLVVFQGIGGGRDANIARWEQQFRSADAGPVEAIVTDLEVDGLAVTMVELAGEHMQMGAQWYTPNQLFLAAIIESPDGDLQIRLVGQTETVEANRAAFEELVRGLRREQGA